MNFKYTSLAVLLSVSLSGCSLFSGLDKMVPDNTQEYRKAETMPPLEVPPDLSSERINDDVVKNSSSAATYSEFKEEAENPLAAKYNITQDIKPALDGEGAARHLIVPLAGAETWQQLESFVDQNGMSVKRADQRIGLMDTTVGADGYAYRLRADRGETSKQTLLFVSAAGMDDNAQKNEAMLRQIADFFGVVHQQEKQELKQEQASLAPEVVGVTLIDETDGYESLLVDKDFPDVWNRVGRVLDSKGFSVEDRDRSRGTYLVRYIDPLVKEEEAGFLSSLAFWRDDVDKTPDQFYNIKLISDADQTKVMVLDSEQVRTKSDSSKRLLKLLQEQLSQ